jgi:hypothetical protein
MMQPEGSVYVIVEIPAETPVARPDALMIVATAVLLLVHVPPPVPLVSVLVVPGQMLNEPPMAVGSGFTTIEVVWKQPVGSV